MLIEIEEGQEPFSCRRKQRVLPERSLYSKPLKERKRPVSRRKLRTREESEEEFLHPIHTVSLHLLEPSPTPPIGEPPRLRPIRVLPAPIILTQPPIDRIQARRIAKYRRNVAEVVVDCVAYVSTGATTWGRSCSILAGGHACPRPAPRASSPRRTLCTYVHVHRRGGYTPTVRRQHTTGIYGTSSVGEGLPRLGTRKTSFVEYPTGTAQPPSNSFNPLRKNQ
ncbi:hypothetical protein ALC62_09381 [Cyphomyrmex costatus]|uniref:Uncharacterized protein n=1 Tax=Cyphomyrmex costatus TaxID=456900 RepID=A0A195CI59_9HYME|nr:hypothetical protein ALC62_09381 [Cyphomyrmex costatus]